jgi:prepilin-type N-terminal cleavage/methylation domain-containing protein
MTNSSKQAFTLVELSIVLLIIGLIIGGITAGSSLIKQAQIRAVLSEVNNIKTALNGFKIQYNSIPGDFTNASTFWSSVSTTCTNATAPVGCNGNGDGLVNWGVNSPVGQGAESLRVWQHLSLAGLVSGNYTGVTTVANQYDLGINIAVSKLNPNGYYFSSENWGGYGLATRLYVTMGAFNAGNPNTTLGISPKDGYNIDNKIDDGVPITGGVLGAFSGGCTSSGNYVLTTDTPLCLIGFYTGY